MIRRGGGDGRIAGFDKAILGRIDRDSNAVGCEGIGLARRGAGHRLGQPAGIELKTPGSCHIMGGFLTLSIRN